jgi:hypothetical protein
MSHGKTMYTSYKYIFDILFPMSHLISHKSFRRSDHDLMTEIKSKIFDDTIDFRLSTLISYFLTVCIHHGDSDDDDAFPPGDSSKKPLWKTEAALAHVHWIY